MESEEVVILGAGLAGLTLAYELESQGIAYVLLEARDRIGGRVHTTTTDSGATIEMGATWFADKHVHLMELIKILNVPFQHQYTGKRVLYDYANPGRTAQLFEVPAATEAQYLFTDGSQSLIRALSEKLDPNRILTDHQVQQLSFDEKGVTVLVNDKALRTERVINTLPPNLFVNKIEISPALPEDLQKVASQTHTWMGESIKVGLEYAQAFWRGHEIGSLLSQFGPASELHDHQHEGKTGNILKGFINPDLHQQGTKVREEKVLEQMKFYFGPELPKATYYEKDWQDDPSTFHPYQAEIMPHQYNGHPIFRQSFFEDRLYFAGSETAQAFPGYLDGAVERGRQVAKQLTSAIHIEASA
ncbi:MAG: FAD-dependent oxidoreductase [Cytophagales bacterium]|nr:FAD-dependent oxidoreductase [Cytophagales bacterium]